MPLDLYIIQTAETLSQQQQKQQPMTSADRITFFLLPQYLTSSSHPAECYTLVLLLLITDLVLLLDASGGHAVDDGIPSRVHVADSQADGQQREEHDHAEPQDDVEHHRVGLVVLLGQVDVINLESRENKC